jgi:hypothetical protein
MVGCTTGSREVPGERKPVIRDDADEEEEEDKDDDDDNSSSSIGTRLGVGRSGFDSQQVAGNFAPHHRLQTDSGAHPASYSTGTGGYFPVGKAAGA